MKMAKASQADLDMASDLASALEAITGRWGAAMPDAIAKLEGDAEVEWFDPDSAEQCKRVVKYFRALANSASLFRVVGGAIVMLDPANALVDPDADTIEHHPDRLQFIAAQTARPLAEYNDDHGNVLWWTLPINEPPYVGQPSDDDWPGYHTHWTPLIVPIVPIPEGCSHG